MRICANLFQLLVFAAIAVLARDNQKQRGPTTPRHKSLEFFSGKKSSGGGVAHKFGQSNHDWVRDGDPSLNQLVSTIFKSYHKEVVPKRPTTVRLDMLMIKVKGTNEREGIFESVVALLMEWQDERLVWNPSDYNNVSFLAFDSGKVWLPDIAMVNSADHLYSISRDSRFVVRVSSDGIMKFVPTGTARTWCELKLLTFPFDKQTCDFEFESWSMDSSTLTINISSSAVVHDSFSSPQWALCDHSSSVYDHYYELSGEIFSRIRFDFVVRRKTTFYIINLIFPCATLSVIQLMVFLIPSSDTTSDRISFGTTNLLTLVVFQTIVTAEMPKSSDSVTSLSKYIISLILISAVGILEAIVAERLLRPRCTPPPLWLMRILQFPLLWKVQLPSGIGRMLLQLWSAGNYFPMKNETADRERCLRRKRTARYHCRKKPFSPFPSKRKFRPILRPPGRFLSENYEYRICRLLKKTPYRQKIREVQRSITIGNGYQGTMRHSPSPVFGSSKFDPMPFDCFQLSSVNKDVDCVEAEIIEIGKMWGVLVTRLDGLTFFLCASCVFFLPLLFFIPVALDGQACRLQH